MSLSRRSIRGTLGKIALAAVGAPMALLVTDGCNTQQVATSLRSLEHSGRVSFVCLSAPDTKPSVGRSVLDCSATRFETPDDYGLSNGETTQPHLYALVTQINRGEVAVIDMSTKNEPVLDSNPQVPGANFLPIAAQPVDIASTSDGDATFVAVAEIGRQGIFALPSRDIRTCPTCAPKKLSDWTACALPGAPGNMLVVDDPAVDHKVRASCDGSYEAVTEPKKDKNGNYIVDVTDGKQDVLDDKGNVIDVKYSGRPKIVTTIPELGAMAIIDAQSLFEPELEADGTPKYNGNDFVYKYPAGSWRACPIERWVPLKVDLPVENPPPAGTGGPTCVDAPPTNPAAQVEFESRPVGLARSENKFFVADSKAPVIHVIDAKTPCEPKEVDPLLPTSIENPGRTVTASAISVSGTLTSTASQYVYAVDDYDGTLMVFDVGPSSTSRFPVTRPHEERTPFQAPDRVDFGVPVRDLVLIERDTPQPIPATGVATEGVRCDPDPALTVCTSDSISCDPETLYRSSSSYDRGAGPTRMRGAFAYLVLATGQIAVVDIDDFDAACRMPRRPSYMNGCPTDLNNQAKSKDFESTGEASCNVVVAHTPRDANYMRTSDKTGQNQPGLQNFPVLYNEQGALQSSVDLGAAVMRAPLPNPPSTDPALTLDQYTLGIGTSTWVIDPTTGFIKNDEKLEYALAANLEDPRAHNTNQAFSVIYEGALRGFDGKAANLSMTTPIKFEDASSRFCDQGVLGQKAFSEILRDENPNATQAEIEADALKYADYVQIASSIPEEDDAHWTDPKVKGTCSFEQCKSAFGPIEIPKTSRDLKIIEAYQDHLDLASPQGAIQSINDPGKTVPVSDVLKCCFPTVVAFNVRVGHQWAVLGQSSQFMHHVIPTTLESSTANRDIGACRNSCDPRLARKNGRVRAVPHGTLLSDGDPRVFINPFFRFVLNEAEDGNPFDANPIGPDDFEVDKDGKFILDMNGKKIPNAAGKVKLADNAPKRGTFFQFNTLGAFKPLVVNLASTTTEIQPQSINFVASTGEIVIVDGSLEGLILLGAGSLNVTRRYF